MAAGARAGSRPIVHEPWRLGPLVWKRIEARAKAKGMTVHAALRQAILSWLESAA
jgi:hypothetical protein